MPPPPRAQRPALPAAPSAGSSAHAAPPRPAAAARKRSAPAALQPAAPTLAAPAPAAARAPSGRPPPLQAGQASRAAGQLSWPASLGRSRLVRPCQPVMATCWLVARPLHSWPRRPPPLITCAGLGQLSLRLLQLGHELNHVAVGRAAGLHRVACGQPAGRHACSRPPPPTCRSACMLSSALPPAPTPGRSRTALPGTAHWLPAAPGTASPPAGPTAARHAPP